MHEILSILDTNLENKNMKEKFLYTRFNNFIWFLTPKTGTRSMHSFFKKNKLNFPIEIVQEIPDDYSNCFKFAFARNPWARLVSTYENKVRLQWENEDFANLPNVKYRINFFKQFKGTSFEKFVQWIDTNGDDHDNHIRQQTSLVPYDLVDFVGKFESLESDFEQLCLRMKIKFYPLEHENSSTRCIHKPLHKHYTEYYDDETREIVAQKYARDIEYFGYKFGE